MQECPRILFVGSNLSGSTSSLLRAFRAEGCEVTHAPLSFRALPFSAGYVLTMFAEAFFTYGRRFRRLRRHTRAGNAAVRTAIAAIVRDHPGTDLIVQMGRNCAAPGRQRLAGVLYTVLTDHTNMVSKNCRILAWIFRNGTPAGDGMTSNDRPTTGRITCLSWDGT